MQAKDCWETSNLNGYDENQAETRTGITCQRWDARYPHRPKVRLNRNKR